MIANLRFALPAALFLIIVGGFLAWQSPHIGAATGDDVLTDSPSPTPSPTLSPSPSPTLTPTPTPTAIPTGPACPAATAPPGGTCPPCPTFGFQANDVGAYSTCAPSPTPWVSPTPCPTVSPTNCDVVPPKAGDANCDTHVDELDALAVIGDIAGAAPAPCRSYSNVKCNDPLDVVDALVILQFKAGITAHIPAWCPPIGAQIAP